MGNAGERPSTDIRQNIGCSEMKGTGSPPPLSFSTPSVSAKVLEVVGKNSPTPPLDTLAQPPPVRKNLQKRARSKYITNNLSIRLADTKSELEKSYWNSFHCCGILTQQGKSVTGKYCNTRWCLTCNRIRTAKLINGYKEPLKELTDKRFVTLTILNVPGDKLKETIEHMTKTITLIQRYFIEKRKTPIIGIRKLEVTYNPVRNDFHPHFHLIVSGEEIAIALIDEWLNRYPTANREAQKEVIADDKSTIELFKYFTKLLTKGNFYIGALDKIFISMYRKRVFQAMGGIRKNISEDISEIESIIYNDLEPREAVWTWIDEATDWVDKENGETLSGYTPSEEVKKLIDTC